MLIQFKIDKSGLCRVKWFQGFIAAWVPLDDLQRHSKGRKPHNSRYCRRSAPGRSPAALKGQKAPQFKIFAVEVPLDCLQRHSSGTKQTSSNLSRRLNRKTAGIIHVWWMNHEKEYVQSNQNRQTGIIPLIPPQNMKKVPTSDYKLYIPWARENTA